MRDGFVEDLIFEHLGDIENLSDEKKKALVESAKNDLDANLDLEKIVSKENFESDDIKEELIKLSDNNLNIKKTKYSPELFNYAQKSILLQIIDKSWKDHLLSLDHLRQGISLRAYGQKDPLNEYKQEAFLMFESMMKQIRFNVTKVISFVEIKTDVPERKIEEVSNNLDNTSKSENKKVPRNAKCPCGSGKKFKHCCGKVTN
jgi:preprotein translocase subunit SecA